MNAQLVIRDPAVMGGALCATGTHVAGKKLFDPRGGCSLEDIGGAQRGRLRRLATP